MRIIIQMNQIIPLSKRTILGAVLTLDNEGYKVTAKGLCLVLIGDKRIKDLAESNVFGYLPSVTSKKLKSRNSKRKQEIDKFYYNKLCGVGGE